MTEALPFSLFVACAPGLEPWLLEELRELGLAPATLAGGAEVETDLAGCYRVLLGCRLGLSARLRLARVRSTHFAHFDKQLSKLGWKAWLPSAPDLRVRATSKSSRLYHTSGIAQRVQGAVAKALGAGANTTSDATGDVSGDVTSDVTTGTHNTTEPPFQLHARFERDVCTLSLDLDGMPLHKRGYRQASTKAPLREDLAAALLRVAGYNGQQVLVDPLCGAGTLAIEAALVATRVVPEGARGFAISQLPFHRPEVMEAVRGSLERRAGGPAAPIVASDRDEGAIRAARANAERASVLERMTLVNAPLSGCPVPALATPPAQPAELGATRGLIVTHPPFGRRLGNRRTLANLYASLGALRRRAGDGYRLALVTSEPALARATGLALRPLLLTDAGGIKVRFYVER